MDALDFIREMLSEPALKHFLSANVSVDVNSLHLMANELIKVHAFMHTTNFKAHTEGEKQGLIEGLRLTARKVGNFMSKIVGHDLEFSSSGSHDLVKEWKETLDLINGFMASCNYSTQTEVGELGHNVIDAVMNSLIDIKEIENFLLEKEGSSNYLTLDEEQSQVLLLIKWFPGFFEQLKASSEMLNLYRVALGNLPALICKACEEHAVALFLIGSHLSVKEKAYDTWYKVKNDLCKMKEYDNRATNNHMWNIFTYCYDDLPYFLKRCFRYLACYPIGYEIPAMSLIEIWIAEGFVMQEEGQTIGETAKKYLEQLVQRSLVWVSMRSSSGGIKYCRVPRSIHEFAIQLSREDGFLVANPDQEKMESLFRLAIHRHNKIQYTEVENNHMHSFLAFDFDKNILGSAVFLRVLELRNSAVPKTSLHKMIYLRYLCLRGSSISELPHNIGDMKYLQTLDIRDTKIKTLDESLWNISKLQHVYVNPSPQIEGPNYEAKISNLQILKTVEVNESWLKDTPDILIGLRKLGLSNWKDLRWQHISFLLGKMRNLLSLSIMSNFLPSEFLDIRAYPNLETVRSIKLEGKWLYNKVIDNVIFPPYLTKLTLINSGLKKDPMRNLEKLQALKFLRLQDGAYTGSQMVCSTDGFPQLLVIQLKNLENLENWEVKPRAMPKLTKLHIVQCQKLNNNIPNLDHVTDKAIHD